MTDDVTSDSAVTQPEGQVESPQTPATVEPKTSDSSSQNAGTPIVPDNNSQVENLNKALKEEREARKAAQRELAAAKGAKRLEGYQGDDLENVMNHPFVQDLLTKQATNELRDGAKLILSRYPQIPKYVAEAILKNPRGYVGEETKDVDTGLMDIADYVESIAGNFQDPTPQPKTVPVIGNNAVSDQGAREDLEIAKIKEIPPEEWTDEQAKAVSDYTKKLRK